MQTKSRKGIILAGGLGTRLYPLTLSLSKQILPVYDKPMIYYPLSTLMLSDIKEILIISNREHLNLYKDLLGDGSKFGIKLIYKIQDEPKGIAEAFIIGEEFIKDSPCALILGDNIFYGANLTSILKKASSNNAGATIISHPVSLNLSKSYGIVEIDEKKNVKNLIEKPKYPKSNFAITGLYYYDENVIEIAKQLKPSKRGELEITELNKKYLGKNNLQVEFLGRGYSWFDAGTPDSLLEASNFISAIQKRQGVLVGSPEEIALKNKWSKKNKFLKNISMHNNSNYYNYVLNISEKK